MNRMTPILFWVLLVWVVFDFFRDHTPKFHQNEPYVPLEGTLFKGRIPAFGKTDTPLTRHNQAVEKMAPKPLLKQKRRKPKPKTLAIKPESACFPPRSPQKPDSPVGASVDRYAYFNNILDASPSAYQLHKRLRSGGVTLRLLALDKWEDEFLLKYSLSNKEGKEFFNQSVSILINGEKESSLSYVPFSCREGEEIYGILRFQSDITSGNKVGIFLVESGGHQRNFKIDNIGYVF